MTDKLLKIIEHYGIQNQVRKFNEESFELTEAIFDYEFTGISDNKEVLNHIAEEIADVLVMVFQFLKYYKINQKEVAKIIDFKIDRQLERIKNEH